MTATDAPIMREVQERAHLKTLRAKTYCFRCPYFSMEDDGKQDVCDPPEGACGLALSDAQALSYAYNEYRRDLFNDLLDVERTIRTTQFTDRKHQAEAERELLVPELADVSVEYAEVRDAYWKLADIWYANQNRQTADHHAPDNDEWKHDGEIYYPMGV